ncbi:IS200/IS605 family transposase [Weeksellaceae bacterium KMM 9713]|uniref:IS200/IS605 family transposase n=1 Tax=Profundicola chukchiensis TaxID=2961959 RepID=A0A9X4MZB2_9FLAO|nr:IS200/IS605 family transposase [Profundicola chukchiensis]MDG4945161.1 IS200/IS605 family transposase [Profundicola chukchiensis]
MSNTYSQIYIQVIFAVKGRKNLIPKEHRIELQKFITGIVNRRDQKLIAIYAMPDHVHLLIGLKPNVAISDIVRDVKAGSSKFISDNNWVYGKFNWQSGYGAFSYSRNQLDRVCEYIANQEHHHKTKTFKEEYLEFLEKFEVEFDSKYLFEWIE